MLLVIEDSFVDKIINFYVPKEILDKKPILAGGFIAAIYSEYIQHKDNVTGEKIREKSISEIEFNLEPNFSDIDIFFLPKEFDFISKTEETAKLLWKSRKPYDNYYIDLNSFQFNLTSPDFDPNSKFLKLTKVSKFAITFRGKNQSKNNYDYQFIIQWASNPEKLIDGFDINICKIAYHDGKIYIHDDFINGRKMQLISIKKQFAKLNEFLWGYCRAIKYKERTKYNLDLSLEKEMIMKYSEIFNFVNNISNDFTSRTNSSKLYHIPPANSSTLPISTIPILSTVNGTLSTVNGTTNTGIVSLFNSTFNTVKMSPAYNYESIVENGVILNCFEIYKPYIYNLIKKCDINTLYYLVDCNDSEMQNILQKRFDERI